MDFIYGLWKVASFGQSTEGVSLYYNHLMTFLGKCLSMKFSLQVGHAGTLDPMATGLLIVCVGKATKIVERLNFIFSLMWLCFYYLLELQKHLAEECLLLMFMEENFFCTYPHHAKLTKLNGWSLRVHFGVLIVKS